MAKVIREKREWKDVVDTMIHHIGTVVSLIFSFLIGPGMASRQVCQYYRTPDNNIISVLTYRRYWTILKVKM
jgi:hypothetical protein